MVDFDLLFENLTGLDEYERSAHLYPALIVALPVGLVAAMYTYGETGPWALLWGLVVFCGGGVLIAQFARDAGKAKEEALFDRWGGKPTTTLLRHQNTNNRTLLQRRHACIEEITGESLPTEEQEKNAPAQADEAYETCVRTLRSRTYNEEIYPLVFAENKAYGFRRNLDGLRQVGIAASLMSFAAVLASLHSSVKIAPSLPEFVPWVIGVCSAGLMVFWIDTVKADWVHLKAESYADRLLDACEMIRAQ